MKFTALSSAVSALVYCLKKKKMMAKFRRTNLVTQFNTFSYTKCGGSCSQYSKKLKSLPASNTSICNPFAKLESFGNLIQQLL